MVIPWQLCRTIGPLLSQRFPLASAKAQPRGGFFTILNFFWQLFFLTTFICSGDFHTNVCFVSLNTDIVYSVELHVLFCFSRGGVCRKTDKHTKGAANMSTAILMTSLKSRPLSEWHSHAGNTKTDSSTLKTMYVQQSPWAPILFESFCRPQYCQLAHVALVYTRNPIYPTRGLTSVRQ